jgi:redox-regulated HSP33 family molecular chaperone
MKKVIVAVALATFVFTSCSEAKKETTSATAESQEGMAGSEKMAAAKVVVEAPDYQAQAEGVKPEVEQILASYLKLKEEITDANAVPAKAQAQAVLAAASQVKVSALPAEQQRFTTEKLNDIKESAARIEGATNVKEQRANLELLAEATFALTKAYGATSQKLFYQHCPMAHEGQGAYWLSATQEIRNPYYGKEMLSCGSTEEVYN